MKHTYYLLVLLVMFNSTNAQKILGEQAVFMDCKNTVGPVLCTNDKLEKDLEDLVTPALFNQQLAEGREYFTLSLIFIVDADGKVIPTETRALCEAEPVRQAALAYVASLQQFYPTDENQKERRSLFFFNYTFVRNNNGIGHHHADYAELGLKGIKPKMLEPDQYPVYPGCEGINDKDSKCLFRNMYKLLSDFRIPPNALPGPVKMRVSIVVNKNGKISIDKIEGGPPDFQREASRILSRLPVIQPANVRGILFRTSFTIPITINVK